MASILPFDRIEVVMDGRGPARLMLGLRVLACVRYLYRGAYRHVSICPMPVENATLTRLAGARSLGLGRLEKIINAEAWNVLEWLDRVTYHDVYG